MDNFDKEEIIPHAMINGRPATIGEVWKIGLENLAEACAAFYEIDTHEGKAAAFMCDAALTYAEKIYKGHDPRMPLNDEEGK